MKRLIIAIIAIAMSGCKKEKEVKWISDPNAYAKYYKGADNYIMIFKNDTIESSSIIGRDYLKSIK
jgi:hypothetical protein